MTSPTTPRTILGTDYILEALAAEGLGHLFMVPGGLVDPFLPALARQKKLTPVIAAHEGGAVYMADGYARASGRFGAALGIGGPGCCNMATAVAAAKTDGSPVLVMTGEVPLDLEDRGAFQDASQATLDDTAVMAPLTRLSKTVATAKNLNHWFRHALTTMWAQPRGPVHLSLTHDALVGESAADYVAVSGFFAHAWRLSMEAAETALRLLADQAGAKSRIAILAGAGVEHDAAAARLKEIAERWSIPVATTLRAKGVFPEDHALSLDVFGYAGSRHATAAILDGELDCLLVLGSGFNERDTMHWTVRERSKAFMIHVNTDMEELTAHGDLGHVVPGSAQPSSTICMRAPPSSPPRSQRERRAGANGARRSRPSRGFTTSRTRAERPRPSIRPRRSPRCARRSPATASSSSIPARTAPSPGTTGAPTRREPTSPPPIWDPWAGRSRRPSACNARGRIAASPSSPATAACRCTASRCRPRRATDCRSSTWSSTIPRSAMSGCARGNTARCRRSSPAFPITTGRDLRALSGRRASPCASPRSSRARSKRRWPPPPPRSSTSRPTRILGPRSTISAPARAPGPITNRRRSMTELDMNPATLLADARALYEKMAARRKAHGEGFGGPYLALLNHPELARRIEELGFFLKFEGALPRTVYPFIVLTAARASGADSEGPVPTAHARAAGLPADVIDCIGSSRIAALPQPYALVHAILEKTMAWQIVPDDLQAQAVTQWGKRGLV